MKETQTKHDLNRERFELTTQGPVRISVSYKSKKLEP